MLTLDMIRSFTELLEKLNLEETDIIAEDPSGQIVQLTLQGKHPSHTVGQRQPMSPMPGRQLNQQNDNSCTSMSNFINFSESYYAEKPQHGVKSTPKAGSLGR